MKFCLCLMLIAVLIEASFESLQEDISKGIHVNGTAKTLSRKRRYLTFPEGSSLQLVYCLTLPSVGVGEIFTIGITAALAWELPSKPEELLLLKGKIKPTTEAPTTTTPSPPHHPVELEYDHHFEEHPSRRVDEPPGYPPAEWSNPNGLFQGPVKSYYNPFVKGESPAYGRFNPVGMSKTPVYERWKYQSGESWKSQGKSPKHFDDYGSNFGNDIDPVYYDHPVYHSIHRRTRRDLYGKIEKLLSALSKDGKSCVMKALCEVSQVPKGKGTFIEEILKTIFRIKPQEEFPDEDDYDKAANANHNCTEKYPTCEHSVWTNMF